MKKLSLLSLILLTLFACRKDIEEPIASTETQLPTVTTIIDYEQEVILVNATLFGIVVDEAGIPIENAIISLNGQNTTTDEEGRFLYKNTDISMNKTGTFFTVNKSGYFEGSDRFFPEEGSVNYAKVTLLSKTPIGNFVSNDGGTTASSEGIELDFPPNAIIDAQGNTYEGEVIVFARWIDPTADNVHEVMPGGLQGLQTEGDDVELVALASFGMMTVELESTDGAPLNLGNDQKATLTFPIADSQLSGAANEIPLWSFSNDYGLWIKEGTATRDGNGSYVGEVSHFSWWNCDDPYTLIELSGTLLGSNDSAFVYQTICLELISTGEVGCINANNDGFFSGPVPMNEEFILTVTSWNNCNVLYTENIGPFSVDTDLGNIVIPDPINNFVELSGTVVNCDNDPLLSGWVTVTVGPNEYTTYTSDGTYSLGFYNCTDEPELTIQSTNVTDLEAGDPVTYPITDVMTIPEIYACGTVLPEYFTVTVNDTTTTFLNVYGFINGDSLSVSANNPNADYSAQLGLANADGLGTYDAGSSYHFLSSGDNTGGFLNHSCFDISCNFMVTITEHGPNSGDFISGTYSGDLEFLDVMQQPVTYFVEAEFRFQRD